jgi:DNA-binding GntR family transcriptional regulator
LANTIDSRSVFCLIGAAASADLEHWMKPLDRPPSLMTLAVEKLRTAIISGDLMLGEQISEINIAGRFGISKTPVREALQQLRAEGLVRVVPQTGTFVFTMSAREVVELCELRLTLEHAALNLALQRDAKGLGNRLTSLVQSMEKVHANGDFRAYLDLDTEFHEQFFRYCGNRYIADAYSRIKGQVAALRTHLAARPEHTRLSLHEHKAMARTIAMGRIVDVPKILADPIARTQTAYAANIVDIAQADRTLGAKRTRITS